MTDDTVPVGPDDAEPTDDPATGQRPAPPGHLGPPRAPSAAGEGVRIITAEEVADSARRGEATERRGAGVPRYGDRPPAVAPPAPPAARFPLTASQRPEDIQRPRPVADDAPHAAADAAVNEPLIPLEPADAGTDEPGGPASAGVVLPHWTEPATGAVPRAVTGDDGDPDARWAASGPRWRDEHAPWSDDEDLMADLAHDDDTDIGALAPDRPTVEQMASLDDIEVPEAGEHRITNPIGTGPGGSVVPGRGGEAGTRRGPLRSRDRGPLPPSGSPPAPPTGGVGGRNMGQAVAVGVGLGVVALILARLGAPWLLILVEVAIVLAGAEYLSALRRAGLEPPTLLGLVAIAALPLAAYARGDAAIAMVLFLLIVFAMLWYLVGAGPGRPVRDIGTMMLAVVHVGVLGAFGALILRIGPVGGATVDQGVSILVLAVLAAVAYDVGGLFMGSRFGRTPLSAASPNKTREGLAGGLVASIVVVVVAVMVIGLTELSLVQALVFAVACAVAAFVGDLSESLVKRDLGVKDMGDLLPGHGGVLDRFDGMLFVLPTAYYVILVLFG